jgi:hypothetical protein
MLKGTSQKKTEITVKDVATALLIGAGAFVAAMIYKKKLAGDDPPIIISDGSLYAKSDNLWESPSHGVHTLKPKGPLLNPGDPIGTVEFVYDGLPPVDLTPGPGLALDITILYGPDPSNFDTIHLTTNNAHRNLTITADNGTFDGLLFSRDLNEDGHILSVSAPGQGPYVPTTTGSELDIYFA